MVFPYLELRWFEVSYLCDTSMAEEVDVPEAEA